MARNTLNSSRFMVPRLSPTPDERQRQITLRTALVGPPTMLSLQDYTNPLHGLFRRKRCLPTATILAHMARRPCKSHGARIGLRFLLGDERPGLIFCDPSDNNWEKAPINTSTSSIRPPPIPDRAALPEHVDETDLARETAVTLINRAASTSNIAVSITSTISPPTPDTATLPICDDVESSSARDPALSFLSRAPSTSHTACLSNNVESRLANVSVESISIATFEHRIGIRQMRIQRIASLEVQSSRGNFLIQRLLEEIEALELQLMRTS